MFYSPSRNFLFIHIPKTGGTSLSLALERHQRVDDVHVGDTPKATWYPTQKPKGPLWKHSTLRDLHGLVDADDPQLNVVTLVRHPMDRIVSMYHYLRQQDFEHPAATVARTHDFRSFLFHPGIVRMMTSSPMASYVMDDHGRLRCNRAIQLERIKTDIVELERDLGIDLDLPHANPSDRGPWQDYFDADSLAHWHKVSRTDFEMFGYAADF